MRHKKLKANDHYQDVVEAVMSNKPFKKFRQYYHIPTDDKNNTHQEM